VRLRSRLAACDRLRVFSRAFNFGIGSPLDEKFFKCLLPSYAKNRRDRRNAAKLREL